MVSTSQPEGVSEQPALPQADSSKAPEPASDAKKRTTVIGLYGVDGCGKTYLLNQLTEKLESHDFNFHDGSQMIAEVTEGGLEAFKELPEEEKKHQRGLAIKEVGLRASKEEKVAIVAGHMMFWDEKKETTNKISTPEDFQTYTHILYLNIPANDIAERRKGDQSEKGKSRPTVSESVLQRWQQEEKTELRARCQEHGILFMLVSSPKGIVDKVMSLVRDFQRHNEQYNLECAGKVLDDLLEPKKSDLRTMLVLDGDKTLAAEDTGMMFWKMMADADPEVDALTLKNLFRGKLGYTYTAFRQAALSYEEATNDNEFKDLCQRIATDVSMHEEFVSLLRQAANYTHVGAVVVTSGLRRVWEMVLEGLGLFSEVKVIGGSRIEDGFVVTAAVKAALVAKMQDEYQLNVWAFGDSTLDLEMLRKADQAIIVVGEKRSESMRAATATAILEKGLQAFQAMIPSSAARLLESDRLPVFHFKRGSFFVTGANCPIIVAMDEHRGAANLLATPMRDASVQGPKLKEAHRLVGRYLAINFLTDVIGLEDCPIKHVQGKTVPGSRLLDEGKTTIVALMRGGDPMASGVNDAFPLAMYVHAKDPPDIKYDDHLKDRSTVILVDSVINKGKTIADFVYHIRCLHTSIRIVVVAGVIQAKAIKERLRSIAHLMDAVVALRASETEFVGSKQTDTGNRLFNSTHLD